MDERKRLEQILLRSQEPRSKITIFCSTKKHLLAGNLTHLFEAVAIHGDKSQGRRRYHVLSQFRNGSSPVLIVTDVVARGVDIRVVINDDFPIGIEDYVYRIGRTGQAGATGVPLLFSMTRIQSTHQTLLNSWRKQINVFLLKFVIWLLIVVVMEWEGAEDGAEVPMNMIQSIMLNPKQ